MLVVLLLPDAAAGRWPSHAVAQPGGGVEALTRGAVAALHCDRLLMDTEP